MPGYPFPASVLLFLLVFCTLCGAGSADSVNMSVELFKRGIIDVLQPKGDGEEGTDVKHSSSPSLVGTGDVMVGLAQAIQTDGKHGILTKYIVTEGDDWSDKAMEGDGKNWKAQWALKSEKTKHISFASVARNNSVYVLSASDEVFAPRSLQRTTNPKAWDFQLTIGTITDGADATGRRIEWDTQNVSDRFVTDIQEKLQDVFPLDGSAFLTEDGTFVFVFKALNRTSRKFVFVIAHSRDPSNYFTFTYVNTTADCRSSFFSWGEQLFMVPKYCFSDNNSDYKLQASNDMGETWREATGPLAEKLGNLTKGRGFFTRTTIEGRRVLLFTKEESEAYAFQEDVALSLFMADENHVEEVGLISTDVAGVSDGSFLYTNDELFFLRVRYEDFNAIFMRLKEQLGKIKWLLST